MNLENGLEWCQVTTKIGALLDISFASLCHSRMQMSKVVEDLLSECEEFQPHVLLYSIELKFNIV